MLTASSFPDAKQNFIKLTNTSELIPMQSTQEIDFLNKPLQWLVLHGFLRHPLPLFFYIRRLSRTNFTCQSALQRQISNAKSNSTESSDQKQQQSMCTFTSHHPDDLQTLGGRLKDDGRGIFTLSTLIWQSICMSQTYNSPPLDDECNLRFNLIVRSNIRVTWVMSLHDEHKLVKWADMIPPKTASSR